MATEKQCERQIAVIVYPGVTALELVGTAARPKRLTRRERATGSCLLELSEPGVRR
jgi:hypothetical protein